MTETNKHLDALIKREQELNKELAETGRQIKAERDRMAFNGYGVSIGSVVLYRDAEYRVTVVDSTWKGKPWLKGQKKLKDGTFGILSRRIFNGWELVKP